MINHTDEILLPALESDTSAVARYNIVDADGNVLYQNVALKLTNSVAQEGTPVNKPLLDEFLAASGVTAGTATAYTLAQTGYALFDGAVIRFRLHITSGKSATLDINETGAKPIRDVTGKAMPDKIPAGAWMTALYSSLADAYIITGGGSGIAEELIAAHKTESGAHTADRITETTAKQFVTAAEKEKWNALKAGGEVLYNVRLASTTTSVTVDLPTEYNYFRIIISDITLSKPTAGAFYINCEDASNNHFYGVGIGENGNSGAAMLKYDSPYVYSMLFPDSSTIGSVTLDAQRVSNGIRGQLTAVTDGGGTSGTETLYVGTWLATKTGVNNMTIYVDGGYGMKAGTGILVMGVK